MSAQEMLIEEIKRQPETVVREILHDLKFLERQRGWKRRWTALLRIPGKNLGRRREWTMTSFSAATWSWWIWA